MSFWDSVGDVWAQGWRMVVPGAPDTRMPFPWESIQSTSSQAAYLIGAERAQNQQSTSDSFYFNQNKDNKQPGPWASGYVMETEEQREQRKREEEIPKPNKDIAVWTPLHDRPFKFNPPLHSHSRPVRVDFGSGWQRAEGPDSASVKQSLRDWHTDMSSMSAKKDLDFMRKLRLGRIVQGDAALGMGGEDDTYRWGFRFLYNPETLTTSVSANHSVQIDSSSVFGLQMSMASNRGSFQSHTVNLILNRQRDLEGTDLDAYKPYVGVSEEDVKGILERGTMWDLEYLWRVCNGVLPLEEAGDSGNLGILQPSPSFLFLGPGIAHFGFVYGVNYVHHRFSRDMVPTVTEVSINFSRIIYVNEDEATRWLGGLGYFEGDYDEQFSSYVSQAEATQQAPSSDGAPDGVYYEGDLPASSSASKPFPGSFRDGTGWTYKNGGFHGAHDYNCPEGTPMLAVRDGVVLDCQDGVTGNACGQSGAPSNWITLGVKWKGRDVTVYYQHLQAGLSVSRGDKVKKGQVIAKSGNTGNSCGAHLHIASMYGRKTKSGRYDYMANNGNNSTIIWPAHRVWTTQ